MTPAFTHALLALGGSPEAVMVIKATIAVSLGLAGAKLARRSRAAVRHAFLAASFAVLLALPVALLVAPEIGIAVPAAARSEPAPAAPSSAPGAVASLAPASNAATPPAPPRPSVLTLSAIAFTVWAAGYIFICLRMIIGLLQLRKLRRSAVPWPQGQAAVDALSREASVQRRVYVLLHDELSGPMTCGALCPAIVLPSDARTWHADDLNRVLLHELEHIRRNDWATQCLARAVCTLYWFHPLVWIARRRLALEAERSCDDAVLRCSESTAYADQLVELARRLSHARSSLILAMASREDLAVRVGSVLDARQPRGRAGVMPVALACAAAVAFVIAIAPLRLIAAPQPTPEFDAVSVKLIDPDLRGENSTEHSDKGRLLMSGTLHRFIVRAYGITDGQLGGEPDWFSKRLYSLEAVTAAPATEPQMMLMLRSVLADRFQLKLRQEDRDLPVYALEIAEGGPKFKELKPGEMPHNPPDQPGIFGHSYASLENLTNALNSVYGGILKLDRTVVDHTGLTGRYNIELRTSSEIETDDFGHRNLLLPDLASDLQSQLGLKLVPERVRMPYFVVEQASAPAPN